MSRKLTISIDDAVYDGVQAAVGKGDIGKFLEDLSRPFVEGLARPFVVTDRSRRPCGFR